MSRRSRIFLGILLIYLAGLGALLYRVVDDIDPRYRESAEESLVETSQLVATLIEQDLADGAIDTRRLPPLFRSLYARSFSAQIYSHNKTRVELRLLVTDQGGRVLFDSLGQREGADFSAWRDISQTLAGRYGARTTRDVLDDPATTVMYVGAPIRWQGRIVGAVSVGKPVQSFGQFIESARRKTLGVFAISALSVLLLALIVSVWLVRPFGLIVDYLRWLRRQRNFHPMRLARHAAHSLRIAWGEMRDALAGRSYVADYVQTLTHEIKSPLSAIRGAAELLQEPLAERMPPAQRQHFLANITRETQRIQETVDRMMELTALETRRSLGPTQPVPLRALIDEVAASARPAAAQRGITIETETPTDTTVDGDPFLLRRALSNLVDNAVDFSPQGGTVTISLTADARHATLSVRDHGPGIPAYAQGKVFEKFYSLARPHSSKKSTGLGLAFVREIAGLHSGRVELSNAAAGGALAALTLPQGAAR